jgi:hypothetical protein
LEKEMNNPKQLILIGGGSSVKEAIPLGLWDKLQGKFTIGLNYSYKVYPATCQTFVDSTFYNQQINDIEKLPMIIGQARNIKKKIPTLIALPCSAIYTRDLQKGAYSARLCGIYTLSLGIYLLDEGEIFLLGYDNGTISKTVDEKRRPISHWYQGEIEHRGVGKCSYYDVKDRGEKDYGVYKQEQRVRIYNVSLQSNIPVFPKISFKEFFQKLDKNTYDQNELRLLIKTKLQGKYKP